MSSHPIAMITANEKSVRAERVYAAAWRYMHTGSQKDLSSAKSFVLCAVDNGARSIVSRFNDMMTVFEHEIAAKGIAPGEIAKRKVVAEEILGRVLRFQNRVEATRVDPGLSKWVMGMYKKPALRAA